MKNYSISLFFKIGFFVFLLNLNSFFGILPFSNIQAKAVILISSVFMFIGTLKLNTKKSKILNIFLFSLYLMLTMACLVSLNQLGWRNEIVLKFIVSCSLVSTLSSIFCVASINYRYILDHILKFSFISNVVTLITAFLFNSTGIFILNTNFVLRNGNLRFNLGGALTPIVTLLSLILFINTPKSKNRILIFLTFISGFLVIFYAAQTRQLIIALLIGIIITIFGNMQKFKDIKKFYVVCVMCFTFILLFNNYISSIIRSIFETSGNYAGSTSIRLQEIDWFTNYVIPKSFPFGLGLYDDVPGSNVYRLARGPYSVYTTTDVGTIGDIVNFGLLGAITVFLLILILLKCGIDDKKYLGLSIFIIYTQLTTWSYFVFSNFMTNPATLMLVLPLLCLGNLKIEFRPTKYFINNKHLEEV